MFVQSKRCGRCRQVLPLDRFNRAGAGHQHWCRACFRAYFSARRTLHLAQVARARRARHEAARAFVLAYLREHPCCDCGEPDPVVLEFDHLRDKRKLISQLVDEAASPKRLLREIAKCDVVCVNCHRRRTATRGNFLRHRVNEQRLVRMRPVVRRNVRWFLALLARSSCVDCGERDPVVLDFDHVGPKRACVIEMVYTTYSLAAIQREIANCEICCANCHRRRTAARGGFYRHAAVQSRPEPP